MSETAGWLVVWPVVIPILAAALAAAAWGNEKAQSRIGVVGLCAQLVAAIVLFIHVWSHGVVAMSMGGWQAPFGIALAADALGAGLTMVGSFVGLIVALHSLGSTSPEQRRAGFFPLFLALMAGVAGAFLTSDIFNLYVWFEVTLISSFGLIVLGGGREQIDGAVKYAFLNLIATTLLLIAIGLLYGLTGTLNMADLSGKVALLAQDSTLETIGLLFLVSLGMKAALFPLYFWLPAAYHTPLPTVSAIFAALLTKVGVYSLIRVFTLVFPESADMAREAMIYLAVATMVIGALGALAETDIRRFVSFTVMSGVGVMVGGLAIGSELAFVGTIFYFIHSIIISAALFIAAGMISDAGKTTKIEALAGLYKKAPYLAVTFLIVGLSLAGIPPLAGFWPKVYLVQAGLEAGSPLLVVGILLSGFLSLVAVGRAFCLIFWRDSEDQAAAPKAVPLVNGSMGAFAAITVVIGLFSAPMVDLSSRSAAQLLQPGPYIETVLGAPQAAVADEEPAAALIGFETEVVQ
ncbi:MAG: Na+/H+ antiporter subunit D [Magnetovibrionaceae bacterium]